MCDPVSVALTIGGGYLGGAAAFGAAGSTLLSAGLFTAAGAAGGAAAGYTAGQAGKSLLGGLTPEAPKIPKSLSGTLAPPTKDNLSRRKGVPTNAATVLTGGSGLVPTASLLGSPSLLGGAG